MSSERTHILHLTERWLRWATLARDGRAFTLERTGELPGDAPTTLTAWIEDPSHRDGRILLYDGRAHYFSFTAQLPARAQKQAEGAVLLRIRQELGVGPESVRWATRAEDQNAAGGMLTFFTVVARSDALKSVAEWQTRNNVAHLWVGADVAAIRTLLEGWPEGSREAAPPGAGATDGARIVNHDGTGADLFFIEDGQPMLKRRAYGLPEPGGRRRRMEFGPEARRDAAAAAPDWGHARPALARLLADSPALARFDAVILGGLLELTDDHSRMKSLLEMSSSAGALGDLARKVQPRQAIVALAAALALLALSLWAVGGLRERSRLKLVEKARLLANDTRVYQSQQSMLGRIQRDRRPLLPVIEALHEAAPKGLLLDSFSIGESGLLQLSGTAQGEEMPNQLFQALSASNQFEKVGMPTMKPAPNGQGTTFNMTAQVKGRGSRRSQ